MFHDNWHELAEKATNEQDPEKLMVLVDELNRVLSQREALRSDTEIRKQ